MALNIKDDETDRLARELAALTGQSITTVVREALQSQLAVLRRRRRSAESDLDAIIARGRTRPCLDERPDAAILGYGEDGLPA